jgi:type III secretion protein J
MQGGGMNEQERPFVTIWSLIIAKESVTRFRFIFFSFTILLVLLLLALIWILWKFSSLIQQAGGIKSFFTLKTLETTPLDKQSVPETKEATEGVGKDKEKEDESNEGDVS